MITQVLLHLLNELGKRDIMQGLSRILSLFRNEYNQSTNIVFYTEQKREVTCIVPKSVTPKWYLKTRICVLIAWKTSGSHLHHVIYFFHHSWQKNQTATEDVSNSKNHVTRRQNDINFHIFHNLRIVFNQNRYEQYEPLTHSVKHFIFLKLSLIAYLASVLLSRFQSHFRIHWMCDGNPLVR